MFLRALKWLSMLLWILLCKMSKIMLFLHKKGVLDGKEIWLGCSVRYPLCAEAVIAKKQSCCYPPNSPVILLWWWLEKILIHTGSWKTKSDFASSVISKALVLCKKIPFIRDNGKFSLHGTCPVSCTLAPLAKWKYNNQFMSCKDKYSQWDNLVAIWKACMLTLC